MQIVAFDPARASRDDMTGYYELLVAVNAVDVPGQATASFEAVADRLRALGSGLSPFRFWLARHNDRVIAAALVELPEAENTHVASVEVRVSPERRRQGVGTAVMNALLPDLRSIGRTRLAGQGLLAGGAGEHWAVSLGFQRMHHYVIQQLTVADVDRNLWRSPVPHGYRLSEWTGEAPEELLKSYAQARNAIHDAPHGDATVQISPKWTPQRVRAHENDVRAQGNEMWTVAAIHLATGEVAGLTELHFYPKYDDEAFQQDTAVVAEHRGHGLGRCMKSAMLNRLVALRPGIGRVGTRTAADNHHMQRVNLDIGYKKVREIVDVEADLAAVATRLGGVHS